ncbi:hypothetical protein BTN49_3017 [Candidatus Enterovibrio escicola]|uniref:Uncharacterized protein n=1 Tax=Candidatus Enterovibrio escicola TaxID=1927127 RepID=A0A2A5SZX8_9GAMM|nr:hypothetical protein BTN49_3017 [Candidatus Enterovibrio escacola]
MMEVIRIFRRIDFLVSVVLIIQKVILLPFISDVRVFLIRQV